MASEMTGEAGLPGDEEAQEESQEEWREVDQDEGQDEGQEDAQEEARLLAELDALVEMHGVNGTGILLGVHASSVSRWSTRRLATTKLANVLGGYLARREFEQGPGFEDEGDTKTTADERADERWESFEERVREVEERRVLSPDDLGGLRLRSWSSRNEWSVWRQRCRRREGRVQC